MHSCQKLGWGVLLNQCPLKINYKKPWLQCYLSQEMSE